MRWIFQLLFVFFIFLDLTKSVNGIAKKIGKVSAGKQSSKKDIVTTTNVPSSVNDQIVGGTSATKSNWAWQVALMVLQNGQYEFKCGGSLVTDDVILTAAHCVRNPDLIPAIMKVIVGEFNRQVQEGTEQTMSVYSIAVHQNYTGTLQSLYSHDIALIKLTSKVNVTEKVSPVPALAENDSQVSLSQCYMTGWGLSNVSQSTSNDLSPKLAEAEVEILLNTECNKNKNWKGLIKHYQICAYNKQTSACLGDSGGPLVCKSGNSFVQHGITSWGSKTCDRKKPSVFTRISFYKNWITKTITGFNV